MERDTSQFNERFQRWKNGESYWDIRNIKLNDNQPNAEKQRYIKSYVDDYFNQYGNGKDGYVRDSGHNVYFDNEGNLVDSVTGEKALCCCQK